MTNTEVAHTTTVAPAPATETALAGWTMTCSCGTVLDNSLSERWARNDEAAHIAYWTSR